MLYDRITDSGYAPTSLTGLYFGMFPRDSSIQAMAHIACGESHAARRILRYLLSCHVALDLPRTAHVLENMRDVPMGAGAEGEMAQRDDERAIYLLNAPANGGVQSFVATTYRVFAVEVSLGKSADTDSVSVLICTDYRDPSSAVCRTDYTFGDSPSGWQYIEFPEPALLEKGKTYYLVLSAPEKSGRVVWNGTTHPCHSPASYNYDLAVHGGWTRSSHHTAFEVLSSAMKSVTKRAAPRACRALGVKTTVFSQFADAVVRAEIRQGSVCLASEATLGREEITHEMIGKCLAWELMYCAATGNQNRIEEILAIELATAARNGNTVYPECWRREDFVTDPGNQEHCSWQFYAMCRAFGQLKIK